MIFYHVLGHIDFFQNNVFYKSTWDTDLTGQALADKRLIAQLRSEKGRRWVDYVIEFSRGIDNLVGFQGELDRAIRSDSPRKLSKEDFYFDMFLQRMKQVSHNEYLKEITRFNDCARSDEDFFELVVSRYPEFGELYKKALEARDDTRLDVMEYIVRHSPFLRAEENQWMKSVIQIVRNTSLYFQPQIRTKIMNEGWASYWHDYLFMRDDRICGHEVDYAKVNAAVTSMPKVGLNPYALGLRLFQHIEDMEDRGCYSLDYDLLKDEVGKKKYDSGKGRGHEYIFNIRENMNDFTFTNKFIDQEFLNRHKLFVTGKRFNQKRMTWVYYIKSKRAEDYRDMVINTLYHPPQIHVDTQKTKDGMLCLDHQFEGKPLKTDWIENTMIGIEFLWGGPVQLETSEPGAEMKQDSAYSNFWDPSSAPPAPQQQATPPKKIQWKRIRYVMENRKLTKREV
jgi:stage V sporulation protein R